MAARVTVTLAGHERLIGKLRNLQKVTLANAKQAIQDAALAVMADAKQLCVVDTGRLRSSIQVQFLNNGMAASVSTNVEYAGFIEFGTGRRGAGTNRQTLPEGYVHGPSAGLTARPFLYPAWEKNRPEFERRLQHLLDGAL